MTQKQNAIVVAESHERQLTIVENRKDVIEHFGTEYRHDLIEDIGTVVHIAVSGDGDFVAGAALHGLCVWDSKTGRRVDRHLFENPISAVALSHTGTVLYVADRSDNSLTKITVGDGARTPIYQADSPVVALAAAADGQCVVGTVDGDIISLDPATGKVRFRRKCRGTPKRLRIYAAVDVLAVEMEGAVRLYALTTGRVLRKAPTSVPVICNGDGGIRIVDPADSQKYVEIPVYTRLMDHSRDGTKIVTHGYGGTRVYCGKEGKPVRRVHTYVNGATDLKLTGDGRYIYLSGGDSTIDKYSAAGGRYGTLADVYCPIMAATQVGRELVLVDQRGVLAVYDLVTGEAERFYHHNACVSKMHVAGSLVATGSYDGTARVFDLASRKVVACFRHRDVPAQAVALDDSGMLVVGTRNGRLRRYDLATGKRVMLYHGHTSSIRCVAVSPCRRFVFSQSGWGEILIFDYESGKLLNQRSDAGFMYSGCFDATGDHVFYGTGNGHVVMARSEDGCVVDRRPHHRSDVRSVALCGEKLVSVGIYDNACVADALSGKVSFNCRIQSSLFRRVGFINDAQTRLVVGGQDGRLRFHDLESGKLLAELHNLDHGFLWTTEPDDDDPEWFYTDRPETIQVYEVREKRETLVPPGDSRHDDYIQSHNSRVATMSRVGMCGGVVTHDLAALYDSAREGVKQENAMKLLEHQRETE